METQKLFFQQIKNALPNHLSLVDEVSELLKISYDSAYRRIRGGRVLSLDELQILSSHFNISLDTLFSQSEIQVKPGAECVLIMDDEYFFNPLVNIVTRTAF